MLRDSIIEAVLKDTTRLKTLLVALTMAIIGGILTKWLGYNLTVEQNVLIASFFTAAFGWIIEGWASDWNRKRAARVQLRLQPVDPSIVPNGVLDDKTLAAASDAATAAVIGSGERPTS